jgi:hypothetical protein
MGAMVFAYDVGALAMTFNYPIFISQSGLEFWILNACLFAAWVGRGPELDSAAGRPTAAPLVRRFWPRPGRGR